MKVADYIPMYRKELHWYEKIALQQAIRLFGRFPIAFLVPEGFDVVYAHVLANGFLAQFPKRYFEGIAGYNALMLNTSFYERFAEYDYILIYQLDAFAFSDQLEHFCEMGYDYIGAPWSFCGHNLVYGKKIKMNVGNGGFCLRSPRACLALLQRYAQDVVRWGYNEDTFFAYFGRKKDNDFRLSPTQIARQFSCEVDAARCVKKNGGNLPFGCHGWHKYSVNFYKKVFKQIGIDLSPYYDQMNDVDLQDQVLRLRGILMLRLCLRLRARLPVSQYLPEGVKWTAHVMGELPMALLQQLRREGKTNITQIFVYQEDDISSLTENMKKVQTTDTKELLLCVKDDTDIVSALEKSGLKYNEDFIAFRKEYENYWVQKLRQPFIDKEATYG